MTAEQQRLFRALAKSGRANTLEEHTNIAYKALIAGGATRREAKLLVLESLAELRAQGMTVPTRMPWGD